MKLNVTAFASLLTGSTTSVDWQGFDTDPELARVALERNEDPNGWDVNAVVAALLSEEE